MERITLSPLPYLAAFLFLSGCLAPSATDSPSTLPPVVPTPSPSVAPTPVLIRASATQTDVFVGGRVGVLHLLGLDVFPECNGRTPFQSGDIWLRLNLLLVRASPMGRVLVRLPLSADEHPPGVVELRDLYDRSYYVDFLHAYEACGATPPEFFYVLTEEQPDVALDLFFAVPRTLYRNKIHVRWDAAMEDGSAIERLEIVFNAAKILEGQATPEPSPTAQGK